MLKLTIAVPIVLCLILIVGVVFLFRLNWSERMVAPLVTTVLGFLATGFVTLSTILKETKIERTSGTIIVFDDEEGTIPPIPLGAGLPFTATGQEKRIQRLRRLYMLGSAQQTITNGQPVDFDPGRAKNPHDAIDFMGELLQTKLLLDFLTYGHRRVEIPLDPETGVGNISTVVPYVLKRESQVDAKSVLNNNRFSSNATIEIESMVSKIRIPEGATISLSKTGELGSGKYMIKIARPIYFDIEIHLQPMGATSRLPNIAGFENGPAVPLGPAAPVGQPQLIGWKRQTYAFMIEMKATFNWMAAGSKETEDAKKWTEWLFQRIESDNSD